MNNKSDIDINSFVKNEYAELKQKFNQCLSSSTSSIFQKVLMKKKKI